MSPHTCSGVAESSVPEMETVQGGRVDTRESVTEPDSIADKQSRVPSFTYRRRRLQGDLGEM